MTLVTNSLSNVLKNYNARRPQTGSDLAVPSWDRDTWPQGYPWYLGSGGFTAGSLSSVNPVNFGGLLTFVSLCLLMSHCSWIFYFLFWCGSADGPAWETAVIRKISWGGLLCLRQSMGGFCKYHLHECQHQKFSTRTLPYSEMMNLLQLSVVLLFFHHIIFVISQIQFVLYLHLAFRYR